MNIPGLNEEVKIGWFEKLCIRIASCDEASLRLCPPGDLSHVKATAELLVATMLYQGALFSVVLNRLFSTPGNIRPELVIGAFLVAYFIMRIDAYTVVGSQFHMAGISELHRGGIDISGGQVARIKARIFLTFRITWSIALAQLTAIFVGLLVFQSDTSAQIQNNYLQANAQLIADATALIDSDIKRETDAVAAQNARVAALSTQVTALRQEQIDPSENPQTQQAQQEVTELLAQKAKADSDVLAARVFATNELGGIKGADENSGMAGNGPRHKAALAQITNAKIYAEEAARQLEAARSRLDEMRKQFSSTSQDTRQQSRDALPAFEDSLAGENRKLSGLKGQLAAMIRGRDDAIRGAVERAPNHVGLSDGFLAQITALERIAEEDHRIAFVILLIDLTSFGLELAAVLSMVTSFIPTTYAALIARDAYLRVVHMADEIVREIDLTMKMADVELPPRNKPPGTQGIGPIFGPTPESGSSNSPPQPPKRPRGRPRKYPLN